MIGPRKLLIVEDDLGLQRQLRWAYDGYEIITATDRAEAIAALRAEEPMVATLDLGLPPDPDGVSEGFATLAEMLARNRRSTSIEFAGVGHAPTLMTPAQIEPIADFLRSSLK